MIQRNQKVVVVSGGDATRAIKVQTGSGTDDLSRFPLIYTDGVRGRDQEVQLVTGGDTTRIPKVTLDIDAYIRSLGPAGWWRMDQGVTVTGAGISQIDDLSGNARHLLDPGTTRPIYLPYSGTKYLYLPGVAGNYASTPDSVANSITGDIDIRFYGSLASWAADSSLVAKQGGAGARSYRLYITSGAPAGRLVFQFSTDGTTNTTIASTVATGFSAGSANWVRVTFDVDNGAGGADCKFWTSSDGVSWTQLGTTQTHGAAVSIFDANRIIEISQTSGIYTAGRIYRAIIKNGIDGTTVVDFNPADASDGATSFASSATGETWTINSSGSLPAQIVGRSSVLMNGTSHYLKTAAFTLTQPTCVLMVLKQVSWTNGDHIFDGNTVASNRAYQSNVTPQIYTSAGLTIGGNGGISVGYVGVLSCCFNGAASYIKTNLAPEVTGNAGTNNMLGFTLGARGDAAAGTFGHIQVYETAIFPIAPSTAQLDRLVAGLMARHGVT